jgi:surface antigen Omp85-like protein
MKTDGLVMRNLTKLVFVLTLSLVPVAPLSAQDAPPDAPPPADNAQQGDRIVDHRPTGYFLKRALHPFAWFDAGVFRPAYGLGTGSLADKVMELRSRRPGPVKFGLAGAGPDSGFGPVITPHHTFFGRALSVQTPLLYTYKGYEVFEINLRVPAADTYFFVNARYRDRPEDKFFGIGNNVPLGNETFYKAVHREADAGFSAAINKNTRATIGLAFDKVGISNPNFGDSAQSFFAASQVPGLFTGATMRRVELSVAHDNQDDPHRATRGGMELAAVGLHQSVDSTNFAYWKYHLELQHYFSLSQDRRKVIAVRALAETNQQQGGSQIPFFDMPYIGSWETLRGFESYRYRDTSALAIGLEYRYRIYRALDWGLFVDRGQVAPQPGDFAWNQLHTGYGVRLFMFPTPKFPVTVDLGRSNEKLRLYINVNPSF